MWRVLHFGVGYSIRGCMVSGEVSTWVIVESIVIAVVVVVVVVVVVAEALVVVAVETKKCGLMRSHHF